MAITRNELFLSRYAPQKPLNQSMATIDDADIAPKNALVFIIPTFPFKKSISDQDVCQIPREFFKFSCASLKTAANSGRKSGGVNAVSPILAKRCAAS